MYNGPVKAHDYQLQVTPNGEDLLKIKKYHEANKDCAQTLPLLPDRLKGADVLEVARWLLYDKFHDWGYLELDIEIDVKEWQKEIEGIKDKFVPHPDQPYQTLYKSCTFHGLSPVHTMHYTYYTDHNLISEERELENHYHWTELADQCPTITAFWKNFPMEQWYRVRPLMIGASGYIGVHRDMTLEEAETWDILGMEFGINCAITHPDGCETWFEGHGKVPWAPGKFFLHNVSKMHWVTNFTDQDRVHMIPMGRVGNRGRDFSKIVVRSYLKSTGQSLDLVKFDD